MATTKPGYTPPFVRSALNYDTDAASDQAGLECPQAEGKTQQQFAEEADINTIVRRFGLTGRLPDNFAMPQSGDFTGVPDFHGAMNMVRQAEEAFMQVPAEVRYRFANDPGRLMAFLEDGRNKDEAQRLGLLRPPPELDKGGEPLPLVAKPTQRALPADRTGGSE